MRITLPVPSDFSLTATVLSHGYVQTAPFGWDGETLERVDRMKPAGRAHVVRIRQVRRSLEVDVIGARSVPEVYRRRLRRMLQLDLSLSSLHRAVAGEPHLAWMKKKKFGRVLRTGDLFEDVVKAICGTNVQWPQAVRMANRICTLGPKASSPRDTSSDRHAFPSPEEVVAAGAGWLRANARTGYRADYIVSLAEEILERKLDCEAFESEAPEMTGEELRKRLLRIRGIGPSTVRYLAGFFGKFDAVSVDSAVINYATRAHFAGKRPSPKRVEEHFDRYGEHRGLVCWFEVWRDWCERNDVAL